MSASKQYATWLYLLCSSTIAETDDRSANALLEIFLSFWIVQAAIIATTLLAFRALSVDLNHRAYNVRRRACLNGWNALQIYKRSGSARSMLACKSYRFPGAEIYILGPDGTTISMPNLFPEERRIATWLDVARSWNWRARR